MQGTLSRFISSRWAPKPTAIGCCQAREAEEKYFGLLVLLSLWALLSPAYATIDDAIASALQGINAYAKQGYTVHDEDEWGGDLGVREQKAIPHTLFKGNDYWFYMSADADNARVAIHIYNDRGRLAEVDSWQKGSHAAARAFSLTTATYYIVVEVTDSSAERTHWAMVYGSKPIPAKKAF